MYKRQSNDDLNTKSLADLLDKDVVLVGKHVFLLIEGGLLHGSSDRSFSFPYQYVGLRLTWQGQQFAMAVVDENVWSSVKIRIHNSGLESVPVSTVIKLAADAVAKALT